MLTGVKLFDTKTVTKFSNLIARNDAAHNEKHIDTVLLTAQLICEKHDIPYTRTIELACVFHDAGMFRCDRKYHHIHAVSEFIQFVEENELNLSVKEIAEVCEAIVNHRSSNLNIDNACLAAKIVHASDKGYPATTKEKFIKKILERSVAYHSIANRTSDEDIEYAHKSAWNHIYNKYTENGYIRYSEFYKNIFKDEIKIQQMLAQMCCIEKWRVGDK